MPTADFALTFRPQPQLPAPWLSNFHRASTKRSSPSSRENGEGADRAGPTDHAEREAHTHDVVDAASAPPGRSLDAAWSHRNDVDLSAAWPMAGEYKLTALIEGAKGGDDDYAPSDESTVEAV